jgi:hypothetical protein
MVSIQNMAINLVNTIVPRGLAASTLIILFSKMFKLGNKKLGREY